MVMQGVPMLMEYTVCQDGAHSQQSIRDQRVSDFLWSLSITSCDLCLLLPVISVYHFLWSLSITSYALCRFRYVCICLVHSVLICLCHFLIRMQLHNTTRGLTRNRASMWREFGKIALQVSQTEHRSIWSLKLSGIWCFHEHRTMSVHKLHVVAESMSPSGPHCSYCVTLCCVLYAVIIVLSSMYKHSIYNYNNCICTKEHSILYIQVMHEHTNGIALNTHNTNIRRCKYMCSSEHST